MSLLSYVACCLLPGHTVQGRAHEGGSWGGLTPTGRPAPQDGSRERRYHAVNARLMTGTPPCLLLGTKAAKAAAGLRVPLPPPGQVLARLAGSGEGAESREQLAWPEGEGRFLRPTAAFVPARLWVLEPVSGEDGGAGGSPREGQGHPCSPAGSSASLTHPVGLAVCCPRCGTCPPL